jgi:hypothetical protein
MGRSTRDGDGYADSPSHPSATTPLMLRWSLYAVNSPIGSNGRQYFSPYLVNQAAGDHDCLPVEIYVLLATRFHQPVGVTDMECAHGRTHAAMRLSPIKHLSALGMLLGKTEVWCVSVAATPNTRQRAAIERPCEASTNRCIGPALRPG